MNIRTGGKYVKNVSYPEWCARAVSAFYSARKIIN